MANNYQQYSIMLDIEKLDVVREILAIVTDLEENPDFNDEHGNPRTVNSSLVDHDWICMMITNINDNGSIGDLYIENGEELWACAEESGNLDGLVDVLQVLLQHDAITNNHPKGVLVTWANTCSKMRPDEFSGGGMLVTKNAVYWQPDAWVWANTVEENTNTEG